MNPIEVIKEKLKKYPSLRFTEDKNSITVHTPNKETGFDVSLYIDTGSYSTYTIAFGNWHNEFDTVDEALNMFAFGLSNECRLRELRKGNTIYKWVVESLVDGNWVKSYTTGLLIFPFWRKTTESVFQNNVITS